MVTALTGAAKGGSMAMVVPTAPGHGPLGAATASTPRANRWKATAALPTTLRATSTRA